MATERNGYCPDIPTSTGQIPIGEIPFRTQAKLPNLVVVQIYAGPIVEYQKSNPKGIIASNNAGTVVEGTFFQTPVNPLD